MKENNIISLSDRLERWQNAYVSPNGDFYVSVSSRGYLKISFRDENKKTVYLDFFESVRFMSEVSKGFETMVMDAI